MNELHKPDGLETMWPCFRIYKAMHFIKTLYELKDFFLLTMQV